ncbi:MAG TPA: hypothetical protein VJ842_20400 [Pyrinomonadaceae bacterium]|nr:hypothetical protein [Pyrinomonadaceae bacterium]
MPRKGMAKPKKISKGSTKARALMTPGMRRFTQDVEKRRVEALARIENIPVAALIWGPAPSARTKVARTRLLLKGELTNRGHLAQFSEDLLDPHSPYSIQSQQVAQAEAHDIVFSIPDSAGSIAEIHDFAKLPWLSHKIVTFLNRKWNKGYANRSLIELKSTVTCEIVLYDSRQLPSYVIDESLRLVRRLQEVYYLAGRRV